MPTHLPSSPAPQQITRRATPRMDGFGTWISIVVLVATVTAAFVMRQNIDDHIYRIAGNGAAAATTTGAAVHDQ